MGKKTTCTIIKFKFFYTKEYLDTSGNLIRSEAYDNESNACYMTTDYFYDEQDCLVRKVENVSNEREQSHTESFFREEGDYHIIESVTRYENPKDDQRDEKRIEVYQDSRLAVRAYDLETGALISDELYDGEDCEYDINHPIKGNHSLKS